MFNTIRPALLSLCLVGLAATPALADRYWDNNGPHQLDGGSRPHYYAPPVYVPAPAPRVVYAPAVLPERAVKRRLHEQGFHNIDHLHFDGRHYRARANDQWGRRVYILASAATGYAIEVRPLAW